MSKSSELGHSSEVWWFKLHHLIEIAIVILLLHVLIDVQVQVPLVLFLVGFVDGVSLPSPLLLVVIFLIFLPVLAVCAVAQLTTFYSFLEANAILFLALGLFACTVDQILDVGLVAVYLL